MTCSSPHHHIYTHKYTYYITSCLHLRELSDQNISPTTTGRSQSQSLCAVSTSICMAFHLLCPCLFASVSIPLSASNLRISLIVNLTYLSVSLPGSLAIFLSGCLCFLSLFLLSFVSNCLSVNKHIICLSSHLPVLICVCLSVCLYLCLCLCLSV